MSKKEFVDRLEDEDFLIRVRPFADDDGTWNGEIDISILSFPDNPMNDDDYGQVLHFIKMMCATVPLMEKDESIRNLVDDYVTSTLDNELDIEVQLENDMSVEKTYEDNVVHLKYNTKTKGSA